MKITGLEGLTRVFECVCVCVCVSGGLGGRETFTILPLGVFFH